MQCLLFILRKTYGYNKKTDSISLSQFVKATGINRGNTARAIKSLVSKNLVYVKRGSVKKDTTSVSKYRFNKRYGSWLTSVKKDTGSVNIDRRVVSKKTHTKDIIQKTDIPPLPPKPKKPKKKFLPPTKEQVVNYFIENGYDGLKGAEAFEFYNCADWFDSRGNKVKNWKQKMIGVWFKDKNKILQNNNGKSNGMTSGDIWIQQRREKENAKQ